jgi:peptide/nickel transport system permease protein
MSGDNKEIHKSPSYYVKKRLLNNKPALVGLIIILIAHAIAILGYLIMPDSTPSANDSAVQIQKQPPGFKVWVLKVRKNMHVDEVNFLVRMLYGQESEYSILPINKYRIKDDRVFVTPFGSNSEESFSLVKIVKPVYSGRSEKFKGPGENYRLEGDKVIYLDYNEEMQSVPLTELTEEFENNNIEQRSYVFGTDKAGRDILSRLLFGTRISLAIGFIAVLISLAVGVTLGALAGFFGGKIDAFIMWVMTVVWSIPSIMLVIAISLALQSRGVGVAFVAVGLTTWVEIARVVRGQILSIKEKLYIEAARAFGIKTFRIIFYHILPNILGPLIVISTANFASAILIEAGLSFLGLSVQPPMPSWGMMISEGFQAIGTQNSWHLVLLPSLCVSMMVLCFNLFGNGLRDAYDPKTILK